MSISIYNGTKIENKSFFELKQWVNTVKNDLIDVQCEIMALRILEQQKKNNISAYLTVFELQSFFLENNTFFDFSLSVNFIPLKDKILCIHYSNIMELNDAWKGLSEVVDYWYSNRSDADESCSDEEWLKRESDWLLALESSAVPAQAGFEIQLLEADPYIVYVQNQIKINAILERLEQEK